MKVHLESVLLSACVLLCLRAERETAARITEEIGNLMKEIENLVEEKKKDSSEMTKMIVPQEGERFREPGYKMSVLYNQSLPSRL